MHRIYVDAAGLSHTNPYAGPGPSGGALVCHFARFNEPYAFCNVHVVVSGYILFNFISQSPPQLKYAFLMHFICAARLEVIARSRSLRRSPVSYRVAATQWCAASLSVRFRRSWCQANAGGCLWRACTARACRANGVNGRRLRASACCWAPLSLGHHVVRLPAWRTNQTLCVATHAAGQNG